MPLCVICKHMDEPPRTATGTVGLLTSLPVLLSGSLEGGGGGDGERHVIIPACPEHVVDVYRGRIEGMRMAWRLGEAELNPARKSPAATSASPA